MLRSQKDKQISKEEPKHTVRRFPIRTLLCLLAAYAGAPSYLYISRFAGMFNFSVYSNQIRLRRILEFPRTSSQYAPRILTIAAVEAGFALDTLTPISPCAVGSLTSRLPICRASVFSIYKNALS